MVLVLVVVASVAGLRPPQPKLAMMMVVPDIDKRMPVGWNETAERWLEGVGSSALEVLVSFRGLALAVLGRAPAQPSPTETKIREKPKKRPSVLGFVGRRLLRWFLIGRPARVLGRWAVIAGIYAAAVYQTALLKSMAKQSLKGAKSAAKSAKEFATQSPAQAATATLEKLRVPKLPQEDLQAYVARRDIERRLRQHVSMGRPEDYLVVVGPRGAGKSFIVKKLLADSKAPVAYVGLTADTPSIDQYLRRELNLRAEKQFKIQQLLEPFAARRGAEKPVLVVEIEGTLDADVVKSQSQIIKALTVDEKLAHGIIVLTSTMSAISLNLDENRQDFLWVGEYTVEEMRDYLNKRGVLLEDGDNGPNTQLRVQLIRDVSTNPKFLARLAAKAIAAGDQSKQLAMAEGKSLPECAMRARQAERSFIESQIKMKQATAARDLRLSLQHAPELEVVLRALVEYPGGVDPARLGISTKSLLTKLDQLKPEIETTVITYNQASKLVVFLSPAHERATSSWVAKQDPNHQADDDNSNNQSW